MAKATQAAQDAINEQYRRAAVATMFDSLVDFTVEAAVTDSLTGTPIDPQRFNDLPLVVQRQVVQGLSPLIPTLVGLAVRPYPKALYEQENPTDGD